MTRRIAPGFPRWPGVIHIEESLGTLERTSV